MTPLLRIIAMLAWLLANASLATPEHVVGIDLGLAGWAAVVLNPFVFAWTGWLAGRRRMALAARASAAMVLLAWLLAPTAWAVARYGPTAFPSFFHGTFRDSPWYFWACLAANAAIHAAANACAARGAANAQ